MIYAQEEYRRKVIEIIMIVLAGLLCVGVVGGIAWLIGMDRGMW